MSGNKTVPNNYPVRDFLDAVEDHRRRDDSYTLSALMSQITGEPPVMWGPAIVGFGTHHYVYDSGREGDMPIVGFSPRKQHLVLYMMTGFDKYRQLLGKLGKHRTGKSCLYLKQLADVDLKILAEIITASFRYFQKKYKS